MGHWSDGTKALDIDPTTKMPWNIDQPNGGQAPDYQSIAIKYTDDWFNGAWMLNQGLDNT